MCHVVKMGFSGLFDLSRIPIEIREKASDPAFKYNLRPADISLVTVNVRSPANAKSLTVVICLRCPDELSYTDEKIALEDA